MLSTVLRHMDWFLEHAVWPDGSPRAGLWWSMLDLKTGGRPVGDRAAGVSKRCYRWIESPNGSNLYWDGPLVVACHALSARTGDPAYARAADRYIAAYLETAASPGGLIWWGNHYYVDASGTPVWFAGFEPKPVDEAHANARLHETRPLPVPWPLLHRVAPSITLAALAAHRQHLSPDGGVGCFNRHADGLVDLAFIEAGGILALSFAYEQHLGGGSQREDLARQVLSYSSSTRHPRTGLMPVNPTHDRWDYHQTTSEIGLWAGGAFAVAALAKQPDLADMAADAVGAWASRAWCEPEQKFHGRLNVATGEPDRGPKPTIYSPGTWSDPWDPLFPAHDYPLQMAEACLTAWEHTQRDAHATAVQRWITQIGHSLPARNGLGSYAEHYGRAIHFLWRAGKVFARPEWTALAHRTADEALGVLSCGPGLRTHPWEDRVEVVDGVGWLILALLGLESDAEPDMAGLFW